MEDTLFETLKKELPNLKQNVLLKDYTTFKIGGPADYFLEAFEKSELVKAINLAKKLEIPMFVFGGGSNLLVSDQGVRGLVIKFSNLQPISLEGTVLSAGGGIPFKEVVQFTLDHSLEGLEWAGGLPGTFGGGIRGNAGAFGGETKDNIISVEALDDQGNIKTFSNAECQFSYRSSIFKEKNWIVLSATINLKPGDKAKLEALATSHINYRNERHPLEYPNAGSIFKNVPVEQFSDEWKEKLKEKIKEDPFPVIPTAYLSSEAGLKGTTVGNAQVSLKHPNFIVNLGDAKAADVLAVIDIIKKKIKEVYGVDLEVEVQMVSF